MQINRITNTFIYTSKINGLKHQNNPNNVVCQNNVNDKIKTELYYPHPSLINFSSKRKYTAGIPKLTETPSKFLINKFENIPCPACGKKLMTRGQFLQFTDELANIPENEYLDFLSNYKEYMRPVEESVFDELTELAKKTDTKDIRELLVHLRDEKLPVLQEAQMKQLHTMYNIAHSLPEDEKKPLIKKLDMLKSSIKKKNQSAPFRRKAMIEKIKKVKISNPNKYKKLQRAANNFPTSKDLNSSWIIKYSGNNKMNEPWKSYHIALRLLSTSIPNTDHIFPYTSYPHHDDISNYMAMHSACNSLKSDKPFLQWLYEDKDNRTQYIEDYLYEVQDLVDKKRIRKKKYRKYVAYATRTINEASQNKLSLFENNPKMKTAIESKKLLPMAEFVHKSKMKNPVE